MMKSTFSRVVALSFLAFAVIPTWAQAPKTAPQMRELNDLSNESFDNGIALIGGFYSKMRFAKSFRGRLEIATTSRVPGAVVSKLEMQSSWTRSSDKAGTLNKSFTSFLQTYSGGGGANEVKQYIQLYDGTNFYEHDKSEHLWSQHAAKSGYKNVVLERTRSAWTTALRDFSTGQVTKTELETIDGIETISFKIGPYTRFRFDAKTGNLQTWSWGDSEITTTFRWTQIEIDVPLANSTFKWTTPKGDKEVPPETIRPGLSLG